MAALVLPTRRDEAWKWSDLKTAFGAEAPVVDVPAADAGEPVIVQLARASRGYVRHDLSPGDSGLRVERLEQPGHDASALDLVLPAGAAMTRVVVQDGPGVCLNQVRVRLGAGAQFRQFVLSFGGRLARLETHVEVAGPGAQVQLNGLYLCAKGRHADLTSVVSHFVGGSQTTQLVKGAVRAGGRGVFQGKIHVARDAQQTDARQHHSALLLEEGADVFAKPELEIFADDVACAHGNTAGALDAAALFYLRARGIPEPAARALLIRAFLQDAVPDWLPDTVAEEVAERLDTWLGAR